MKLVTETQRRLYGITKEALSLEDLQTILNEFGILRACEVEVNFATLQSLANPETNRIIVRVTGPDGTEKSVVCGMELRETITTMLEVSGLVLKDMYKGIYTYIPKPPA